ncbi:MAG TPA: hypothetical protein VF773_11240 [Verrucomicrobiae bacterium]
MATPMKKEGRLTAGKLMAVSIPFLALIGAYLFLDQLRLRLADNYESYREFWGGNPSEVFSHWLDMVLMTGGATMMAWFFGAEVLFRRSSQAFMCRLCHACLAILLIVNGVIAIVLDGRHGEGTVLIVYPFLFIPILASSYYLLRRFAALSGWRPSAVIPLCLCFAVLHTVAQLYYEPSDSGAPNTNVFVLWLASVGIALVWAFVGSIRSGLFGRSCAWFLSMGRKPIMWGSTILLVVVITIYAHQVRKPRERMAKTWLSELETKLTDAFVEEIKRDHKPNKADQQSRIPISRAAHALLTDERIKGENALRIYIPLNQDDYLFLWGNDRFQYCDIRRLVSDHTEQIDQGFINALLESDGTHQTGLYSALWKPYMAGRVVKDATGRVKAVCVINAP